jgi:iron(III) transport system ATP-binding protein
VADEVALMRAGRFVQVDTPAGLYESPVDAETAAFVGGGGLLRATVSSGRAHTVLGDIATSAPDGRARVLVRPEQILVHEATTGTPATVTEVSFYGAHVIVHLEIGDGTVLAARGPSTRTPSPGDRVGITVDGDVVAFPDGPTNGATT